MQKENTRFSLRIAVCFILLLTMMFCCTLRLFYIGGSITTAAALQNTVSVPVENGRGMIFDRNGNALYKNNKIACVFLPCAKSRQSIADFCAGKELENALLKLQNNLPALLICDQAIEQEGVYCLPITDRTAALYGTEHLLGYLNAEKNGAAGLEAAYDALLKSNGETSLCFSTDAAGNYLIGTKPVLQRDQNQNAVFLTLDLSLQQIIAEETAALTTGGVVVTETATGKIRAMISKPGYDIGNLSAYLNAANSPFINRCLSCYNVGSAFKPLIAAALLETGEGNYLYNCTGSCIIGGRTFNCHLHAGHGKMSLESALEQSCNTYFYNAATKVQPKKFIDLARALQFQSSFSLVSGIPVDRGTLASTDILASTPAALANFAIGQGELLLSPLVMTNLYSAIANGGFYYAPTLVEGLRQNGRYEAAETGAKGVVFGSNTALQLKQYLAGVLQNGTGRSALPNVGGACGKTATAQTGRVKNGIEQTHSWFCGFFPEKQPRYTVTVFIENAETASLKATNIFKNIADRVNLAEKEKN